MYLHVRENSKWECLGQLKPSRFSGISDGRVNLANGDVIYCSGIMVALSEKDDLNV